jgi:hypothetical protein
MLPLEAFDCGTFNVFVNGEPKRFPPMTPRASSETTGGLGVDGASLKN